jgi:hypothetical protein
VARTRLQTASGPHPAITITLTDEVYRCSVVGPGPKYADLMRNAVPLIPYANEYRLEFFSARLGRVVIAPAVGGLDYAATCLKRQTG